MLRLALLLAALAAPAAAECTGRNLIDALPAPDRAALENVVNAQPFARGNYWQATRGDARIVVIGTYHLNDPRLEAEMTRLLPLIAQADQVLVEAGPEEERRLVDAMTRDPSLTMIVDGPTIPEQLSEADWALTMEALRARGIPPFVAAKFQPWYLSMILGVAPCAMDQSAALGLDKRIIAAAQADGKPVKGLEPWDTILGLFTDMPGEQQLDAIRMTLPMERQSADYAVTLADGYFAGEARRMWEFLRIGTASMPGYDQPRADAEFAEMERILMSGRNRAWLPVLEDAADHGPVLAAFGALHLAGHDGVLALLERAGFAVSPLPR